ncbi:MAG: helix-turn-helix domain-containing protein [Pseudomonadota bacterium]
MPSEADYQALEAENDELRARIDDLERALFADVIVPFDWGLTANESRVVACLLSRPFATKDALMAALYRNDGKDEAHIKIIDVFVCKARKKLAPFGVEIKTLWGQGYMVDEAIRRTVLSGSVELISDKTGVAAE